MEQNIGTLEDLFVYQGREMYKVCQVELRELPLILKRVSNHDLKRVIAQEIITTNDVKNTIEDGFRLLNVSPTGDTVDWNSWLFKRTRGLIAQCMNPSIDDIGMIYPLRQMNYHKITALGNLRSFAREIGLKNLAHEIQQLAEAKESLDSELHETANYILCDEDLGALAH